MFPLSPGVSTADIPLSDISIGEEDTNGALSGLRLEEEEIQLADFLLHCNLLYIFYDMNNCFYEPPSK